MLIATLLGSKEAGRKLLEMLILGKSKPWKEIMEIMTGTPGMETSALREYFMPLEVWLTKYNKDQNNHVGWMTKDFKTFCSSGLQLSSALLSSISTFMIPVVILSIKM